MVNPVESIKVLWELLLKLSHQSNRTKNQPTTKQRQRKHTNNYLSVSSSTYYTSGKLFQLVSVKFHCHLDKCTIIYPSFLLGEFYEFIWLMLILLLLVLSMKLWYHRTAYIAILIFGLTWHGTSVLSFHLKDGAFEIYWPWGTTTKNMCFLFIWTSCRFGHAWSS